MRNGGSGVKKMEAPQVLERRDRKGTGGFPGLSSRAKSRDLHCRMKSALTSLYGNDDSMHRFKAFKQATFDGLQERFLSYARNDDTGDAFSKKAEKPPPQV